MTQKSKITDERALEKNELHNIHKQPHFDTLVTSF